MIRKLAAAALLLSALEATTLTAQSTLPHFERRGSTTQLLVDGQPFLMLSGELLNSSSSSLDYMKPAWPQLAAMHLNTVITPLTWELVEPTEGHFDFALVDGLLAQAREQHLHIVFLWLAAWKNGMSSYPPAWIKSDTRRFPRAVLNGAPAQILSTFAPATREADATAFAALMTHLREADPQHTVLMMQVENEVGILGASRDHSPAAEQAFAAPVPAELPRFLSTHRDTLNPELRTLWEQHGAKTSGTWTDLFGDSARTDEIFMAWNYARYVQTIAARGKAAYALPLYVNAWLGGGDARPGDYPSGGPQPRVLDIWKAAGSALDLFAPDLYAADFSGWATQYHRLDNPFFLPETNGGSAGAANVFYALGEHAALGFSPFAIDGGLHNEPSTGPAPDAAAKGRADLTRSYALLAQIIPQLTAAQAAGTVHGFVLNQAHPSVDFVLHGLTWRVSLDEIFGNHATEGFGLILEDPAHPGTFLGAGKGFRVAFTPRDPSAPRVEFASIEEGEFTGNSQPATWTPGRHLNGDENDQGAYWRFDSRTAKLERATLTPIH